MSTSPVESSAAATLELSEAERKQRKAEKKARKLARREAKAQESGATTATSTANASAEEDNADTEMKDVAASTAQASDAPVSNGKKSKKDKKRKLDEVTEQPDASSADATPTAVAAADEEQPSKKKDKKKHKKEKKAAAAESTNAGDANAATPVASTSAAPVTTEKPAPVDVAAFLKENKISYEPEETATSLFPPVLSFAALPLDSGIRKGLSGYEKPTPIQSASFPVMMAGRDVIGIAETGSGKTVAFGVPAIQHILSLPSNSNSTKNPVSVLVIAPTRELAMQTHSNLAAVAAALPNVSSICIYGGVSKDDQKRQLKREGPRIVVGTPGRILDLAREGALILSSVSWLVLDEADRMLDKGFENDIREIIKFALPVPETSLGPVQATGAGQKPVARQTCMFSATWPMSVRRLAADFMRSPVRITVGADELTANSRVDQKVFVLDDGREKERRLVNVLNEHGFVKGGLGNGKGGKGKDVEKALVFALYKKEATRVMEFLERGGWKVGCIQGDMSQERRSKSLDDFKEGRVQILVATDVAARGLDIPKVELVVNQTFPLTIEDYIHRIGRTGRAGRKGKSVTFFTEADKAHAGELIRVLKDGGHDVPEGMYQWGTTIKKATHSTYGAFFREDVKGTAKKIKFD